MKANRSGERKTSGVTDCLAVWQRDIFMAITAFYVSSIYSLFMHVILSYFRLLLPHYWDKKKHWNFQSYTLLIYEILQMMYNLVPSPVHLGLLTVFMLDIWCFNIFVGIISADQFHRYGVVEHMTWR